MEIVNVNKGEGNLSLKIENKEVKFIVSYDGQQANAKLEISLGIEEYAQMLKDAIPGTIDDTVIDLLIAAMK